LVWSDLTFITEVLSKLSFPNLTFLTVNSR